MEMDYFPNNSGIESDPEFSFWVHHSIIISNAIISAVNVRVRNRYLKYGIEFFTSIEHDRYTKISNGNTLWMESIRKEIYNVGLAFEVLEEGANSPKGCSRVTVHIV